MAGLVGAVLVTVAIGLIQWRIGFSRMRKMLAENGDVIKEPALETVIAKLGDAAGVPNLKARVFDMDVINGLATPDGGVFISSALLHKHRFGIISAEEVGSVIAHELGHVALGHHSRRMIDYTGRNAAAIVAGALLNRFIPVLGFYIMQVIGNLLLARLSRRDEFEADRYATALMIRAGFGERPQIAMFEKLARMSPGPRPAAWLDSHPPIPERVAAIRENAETWRATA